MKQLVEMVVFARVVESRGFTAAARLLGMTTSAVSRNVARLEAHMGGRLLNRSTRAVSVTELGQAVYAGCASIAETAREVEAFAGHYASTPSGRLKVSAPVSYGQLCIAPTLSRFIAQFPEIDVQLDLTERLVDVVGESYDVAIRIVPTLPPGLVARPMASTSTLLVASRNYLAQAGTPSEPADLAFHTGVTMDRAEMTGELLLRRGTSECRVPLATRLTINNGAAVVAAVCEDMGIGLVPDYAARSALRQGALVQVLPDWKLDDPQGNLTVHAIYAPTRHLPRKVRAFIDFFVHQNAEQQPYRRPLVVQAA
jgi:DNA-binding transcriptional LysR family regulator